MEAEFIPTLKVLFGFFRKKPIPFRSTIQTSVHYRPNRFVIMYDIDLLKIVKVICHIILNQ
jgi:hypothetical protein